MDGGRDIGPISRDEELQSVQREELMSLPGPRKGCLEAACRRPSVEGTLRPVGGEESIVDHMFVFSFERATIAGASSQSRLFPLFCPRPTLDFVDPPTHKHGIGVHPRVRCQEVV